MSKTAAILIFITLLSSGMGDIKSKDFFLEHPEMLAGEKCIGNHTLPEFNRLGYKTKRMGEIAYNRDGTAVTELGFKPGQYKPVFVNVEEYEAHKQAKDTGR